MLCAVLLAACGQEPSAQPDPIRAVQADLKRHYDMFASEALAMRLARVRPHVEAVLGAPLGNAVPVVLLSREMYAARLAEHAVELSEGLSRAERGRLRILTRVMAAQRIATRLGEVLKPDEGVFLLPDNFLGCAAKHRGAILDVVLAHELAHVFQARRFGLERYLDDTEGERQDARRAAIEGHAEFVARKVAARLGIDFAFARLATGREVSLDGLSPLEIATLRQERAPIAFRYAEGERFFAALAKLLGHTKALKRVFEDPPKSYWDILNPKRYIAGERAQGMLSLARVVAEHGSGDETAHVLLAPAVRLQVGDALTGVVRSMLVRLSVGRGALAGRQVRTYVTRCDSPESAQAFLDGVRRASRHEGGRAVYPDQVWRVVRAKYSDRPDGVFHASRTVRAKQGRPTDAQSVALRRGDLVLQMFALLPMDDTPFLARLAGRVLDTLSDLPAASMSSVDPAQRVRGLLARARNGWAATAPYPEFVQLLDDPDAEVRASAVALFAGNGSEQARRFLKQARLHRDPGVRARAVALLGRHQDMDEALSDKHVRVRLAAVVSLAARGWFTRAPEAAIDALLADSSPRVRAATLEGLEHLEPVPWQKLMPRTRDPDPGVRGRAWGGLQVDGPADDLVKEALTRGISDPDVYVRRQVGLYLMARASQADTVLALEALGAMLEDPDPIVRVLATLPLTLLGKKATPLLPQLVKALEREELRGAAVSKLRSFEAPEATAALVPYITDPEQRRKIAAALGSFEPARPLLQELLRDWDPRVELAAAVALRERGDTTVDVATLALAVLRSDVPDSEAAKALGDLAEEEQLGERADEVRRTLLAALQADDEMLRAATVEALVELRPVSEPVVEAIAALLRDGESLVRYVAIQAVRKLGEAAATAVPQLVALIEDGSEWPELSDCAEALAWIGSAAKPALPALRKLLDHEEKYVRDSARDAIERIEGSG